MTKKLILLATLLAAVDVQAFPQEESSAPPGRTVESIEVSGISRDRLSPGLNQAIDDLLDQPLSQDRIDELARRFEEEQPEFVAAARAVARQEGSVRVVFLVARVADDESEQLSNVNEQYEIESVELEGAEESILSAELRDAMQALVGMTLDDDEADALEERLVEYLDGYDVRRRVERGSEQGFLRMVFEVERTPWIPFRPGWSGLAYHSKLGWTGALDIPFEVQGDHRLSVGMVFGDNDRFVERTYGYTIGYENRRAGTEHLGFGIQFASLRSKWTSASLAAIAGNPDLPLPYRDRQTVEPRVTFAFTPSLRVSAGASFSEVESLTTSPATIASNAVTASLNYRGSWDTASGANQTLDAGYGVRAGASTLGSDLSFTRHEGQFRFMVENGRNTVVSHLTGGHLSGRAPMFERFAVGDTATLRGWNKQDLAPGGADNYFHHTLEYRHRGSVVFFDTGSVWNRGADPSVRVSAGVGFADGPFSMVLGFPLGSEGVSPMFMVRIGFRPQPRFWF